MPSKQPHGPARGAAASSPNKAAWRPALTFAVLLAGVFGLIWWLAPADAASGPAASQRPAAGAASAAAPQGGWPFGSGPNLSAAEQQKQSRLTIATERLARATEVFESYRTSTRYPHESRPIAEQTDQIYPNRPVAEDQPLMSEDGQVDPEISVKTSQSRVFVAGGESVLFTVAARDRQGKSLPISITKAVARGITAQGSALGTPQTLPMFNDNGSDGDVGAGDGTLSNLLTPSLTAFAQFNGTIRLEVGIKAGSRAGSHRFDIVYTPEIPASWSGPIREAQEAGSLNLYLPATVRTAGRYIVSGRLDDAAGKPFALVTFNEELPAGPQQIKLTAFGKLIRDQNPTFPLTLRDVEGYLLKENTFPDRALMPRLVGTAYVSKRYAASSFSEAEWSSEERDRYLKEYGKDVDEAKDVLGKLKQPCPPNAPDDAHCAH